MQVVSDCIFCKIVAGKIPAEIFWEDGAFMAFLSIDPNTEGFSVVIPKNHFDSDVLKMPDDILQRYILATKHVAQILEKTFPDVGRVGSIMEGTGINHAHIKLVPMHGTEFLKNGNWQAVPSHQKHWFDTYPGWLSSASGPVADSEKLKKLAKAMREKAQS